MAKKVIMPKLGLTMTEGKLVEWIKKEGEEVKKGDILFRVETDKLTNDIEAMDEGILRKSVVEEGETVPCLGTVGIIGTADENIDDLDI